MGLRIKQLERKGEGKRIDAVVKASPFWGDSYLATIRILSGTPIEEGDEKELLEQIVERRKEWKKGKKNQFLPLKEINGTAYILKIETPDEW